MSAEEDQAEHDHHRAPRVGRAHLPGDALLLDDQVRRDGSRLMEAIRAERIMDDPAPRGFSTDYGVLDRRQVAELSAPGAAIGLLGGVIAGGLLAISGLSLAITLVAGVLLAVPLAVAGGLYELLLAKGRLPMGTLTGAAMLWAVAWLVIRVVHGAVVDLIAGNGIATPNGIPGFFVYQVIVSVPFAIGFWWLHENFAPRWWFRIRDRNPVENPFIRTQLQYAGAAEDEKERQRERRAARAEARRNKS